MLQNSPWDQVEAGILPESLQLFAFCFFFSFFFSFVFCFPHFFTNFFWKYCFNKSLIHVSCLRINFWGIWPKARICYSYFSITIPKFTMIQKKKCFYIDNPLIIPSVCVCIKDRLGGNIGTYVLRNMVDWNNSECSALVRTYRIK